MLKQELIVPHIPCVSDDVEPYAIGGLVNLSGRLNAAKDPLDKVTNERSWLRFTAIIDTYKTMRRDIERRYNARHVTNAWMKYWELYSEFPAMTTPPAGDRPLVAFFNAELPGSSLCAFNHFMRTAGRPFDWWASSYAPAEGNTALEDTYGLYAANRDKWLQGAPRVDDPATINTGDMTNIDNVLDYAARLGSASVDLYSHDAGMCVGDDYNGQEAINARLHAGCALCGLLVLRRGGWFIAKQYTWFETSTWNLILVYAALFDSFWLCKPATSRPGNSEVYLVGGGFRGLPEQIRSALVDRLRVVSLHPQGPVMAPLIPLDEIHGALSEPVAVLERFARVVFGRQMATLRANVALFEKYKRNLRALDLTSKHRAEQTQWLLRYPIMMINDTDQLASSSTQRY